MKKGFTLVELLAVISLLAVLIIVSYTFITKALNNSSNEVSKAALKLITVGCEEYINDNYNTYDKYDSQTVSCIKLEELINGNYISATTLQQANLTVNNYLTIHGNGSSFDIGVDNNNVCQN